MENQEKLSRRELMFYGARFAAVGLVALPVLNSLSGCGGGSQNKFVDDDGNTDDPALMYVARLNSRAVTHYDAVHGDPLADCPLCKHESPLALGSQVNYSVRFEGPDPSLLPPSTLSDFTPDGPPTLPLPAPASRAAAPHDNYPIEQYFGFLYVKAGRVDAHPFRRTEPAPPCVEEKVKHTHLIIKPKKGIPDTKGYLYLHVGAYETADSYCFAMYDKINQSICYKKCFSKNDTESGLQFMQESLNEILKVVLVSILGFLVADSILTLVSGVLATAVIEPIVPLLLAI